jgi:hypothetical protein
VVADFSVGRFGNRFLGVAEGSGCHLSCLSWIFLGGGSIFAEHFGKNNRKLLCRELSGMVARFALVVETH